MKILLLANQLFDKLSFDKSLKMIDGDTNQVIVHNYIADKEYIWELIPNGRVLIRDAMKAVCNR